MIYTWNNFTIIFELSSDNNNFKLKVYDNTTNKLYQDIFDDTKLNYKPAHIYKLLIDVLSDQNNDIQINILDDTINIIIIKLYYNGDYCEINQELIIYEDITESTIVCKSYEIEKINKKVENLELLLTNLSNKLHDMGLGISISNKDYIQLNTKMLGISCFEVTHTHYINSNDDIKDFLKNYNLYDGYCEDYRLHRGPRIVNGISNKYTFETKNSFYIKSKVEAISCDELCHVDKSPTKYNQVWCNHYKFKIFNIYNTKYRDIYKNNENTNSYIINNTLLEFTNDNIEYFMNNIKYLHKLTHLCIDCMYIKQFIPEYLSTSIEYLYIIDIDQEVLTGLDHLNNLKILTLQFGMGIKLLINASIQIKRLLIKNPEIEIIIDNYNELKHKDLELITLAKFI